MAAICGLPGFVAAPGTKPQVNAGCDVSEGGLEPLAYILHSSAGTWLDLPTQAVEP
jgi:hypothetical protein